MPRHHASHRDRRAFSSRSPRYKARSANPEHPLYRAHLASAYALKGETERAVAEIAEAQRLTADGRYSSIAHLTAAQYLGVPKIRALIENTYFAGLRKAGLPEE